jgi:hypothetical protein
VVCGGEYTDASGTIKQDWNNSCEIYDPVANTWSSFPSPTKPGSLAVWEEIGDASCTLLPDGTFLMGSVDSANIAKLDAATLTWSAMNPRRSVGTSDEDSWVLMPDNTVVAPSCQNPTTTWVYDIATDQWNPGNSLPVSIVVVLPMRSVLRCLDTTAQPSSSGLTSTPPSIRQRLVHNGQTAVICRQKADKA